MGGVRVAICDDNQAVREALASFLGADDTVEVVALYRDGVEALLGVARDRVQVLLLDVRMPGLDGPQVAARLRASAVHVVYLTSYPEAVQIDEALAGTVVGALTKDLPPDDLVRAVHMAARGVMMLSPTIRSSYQPPAPRAARMDVAHDAVETEVLTLLCQGQSNEQIAANLHRSVSGVKQALVRMSRRAGVHSRTELVLYVLDGAPGEDRASLH